MGGQAVPQQAGLGWTVPKDLGTCRARVCTAMEQPCPETGLAPAAPSWGQLCPSGPFLGPHQALVALLQAQPGFSEPISGTARPPDALTPRRLMASLSSPTTLFPSAPEALKPLVQFRRMPWNGGQTEMGLWLQLRLKDLSDLVLLGHPLTLSMSSCRTGKEKVKPRGSFLCFIWCLSRKSEMHSEM